MKETNNMKNASDEQARKFVENDAALKNLTNQYNTNKKILAENVTGVKGLTEALNREITIENEAKKNNAELLNIRKQINTATKAGADAVEEINKKIDANNKFIKENVSEYEKQKISISGYKDEIKDAFGEITSGNVKGGLKDLMSGIKGITLASLEFIATPIGAAFTALVGIGFGVKAMFDYNTEIKENIKLVENLTGRTGELADSIRNTITGLSETFGVEFKDIANAVDNLMDTGVAKNELEALDQIKQGLLTAPDKNEFINSLENTALTAKQVGLNLKEVISAKQSIEARGIDGEAVFGSLQKATQRLAEGGKNVSESLTNAFGSAFSEDILNKIKNGELTTSQALEKINQKSKEVSLNQTQQANLQIDLFGKQSLAAGGFAEIMGVVGDTIAKTKQPLTEIQQKTLEIANANIELAKAKDEALKSDNVLSFQHDLKNLWTTIQTVWYNFVGALGDSLNGLKLGARNIADFFGILPKYFNSAATAIKNDIVNLGSVFASLKDVAKDIFTFNFDKVDYDLNKLKNSFKNSFSEIKNVGKEFSKEFGVDGRINTKNVNEIRNTQKAKANYESSQSEKTSSGKSGFDVSEDSDGKPKKKEHLPKTESVIEAKKKQQEALLNLAMEQANQETKIAKDALLEYNRINREKFQNEKKLTQEILNEKVLALQKQSELESNALKEETEAKIISEYAKANKGKVITQEELASKLLSNQEYLSNKEKIEFDHEEKIKQLKEQFEADEKTRQDSKLEFDKSQKALEYENEIMNLEAMGAAKDVIQTAENERNLEIELQKIDENRAKAIADLDEQTLNAQQKADAIALIETNARLKKEQAEKQSAKVQKDIDYENTRARLYAYGNMFGGIAKLLGEHTVAGKAAGIAQATINTYQGVTEVWKTKSVLPEPMATIAKVVNTGVVLASGLGAVQKITNTETPKMEKGGLISIGGKRHSQGGTKFMGEDGTAFEAEQGEMIAVVNRNTAQFLMGINDRFAGTSTPRKNYFADGGIVARNNINPAIHINTDALASKIGANVSGVMVDVVKNLPNPIVTVEDINYGQTSYAQVVDGATTV